MSKKGGLGKGLGAIFVENDNPLVAEVGFEEKNNIEVAIKNEINVKDIKPNPYQPRQTFDEEKLQELAASIKEFGIVEPLVVRTKGSKYELVAGERRLRAAKLAGLETVPVVVKEYDDVKLMEIALVENIQRHDLTAIEEAKGLRLLMTECKLTQEQVADKVGRSRSAVANILRLLNLPEEIQYYISTNELTMGQVKPLSSLASEEQQCEVARLVITNDWSARIVEEVVRKLKEGKELEVICEVVEKKQKPEKEKKTAEATREQEIFFKDYENKLVEFLGTKVKVQPKKSKNGESCGTIQIEYYSEDDLARIFEAMQPKENTASKVIGERRLHV